MDADRMDLLQKFDTDGTSESRYAVESHCASVSQGPMDYECAMDSPKLDTMILALTRWAANAEEE